MRFEWDFGKNFPRVQQDPELNSNPGKPRNVGKRAIVVAAAAAQSNPCRAAGEPGHEHKIAGSEDVVGVGSS